MTFKAFYDVLSVQGDTIRDLERSMSRKADAADVELMVSSRASGAEIQAKLTEVSCHRALW